MGVAFQSIVSSALLFIVPSDNPELIALANVKGSADVVKNWQNIPMILPEQGVARKSANQWFDNIGVTPNIYAQVAGNEAIVSMVSLGFGVGIVPKIVLSNSPLKNTVSVVTPPQALAAFNIGLFTLEKKTQKPSYPSFLAT